MRNFLNQRQLLAAVAVRQMGTVTRAADFLSITQPAISRLIAQLEEVVGFELFERQGGRLVPSPRGERFLDRAERFISDNSDLARFAGDLKEGRNDVLEIIAVPTLAQTLLPTAFALLSTSQIIRARVVTAQRHDIPRLLRQRRFDIGVVTLPVEPENMRIEHFGRMGAVCLLPSDHPLAELSTVPVERLADFTFIAPGESTLLVQRLRDALALRGETIKADLTVETTAVIHQFVAKKLGISIGHAFSELDRPDGVVTRPMLPSLAIDYAFLFPNAGNLKPAAKMLAETIRHIASEMGP